MIVDVSPSIPGSHYWKAFKKAMNSGPALDRDDKAKLLGFVIRKFRYIEDDGYEYLKEVEIEFESEKDFTMFMLKWG